MFGIFQGVLINCQHITELSRGEDMSIANILMDVVRLSRVLKVNPEEALDAKNEEFIREFREKEI